MKSLPSVMADRFQVRQVPVNLLSKAIDPIASKTDPDSSSYSRTLTKATG